MAIDWASLRAEIVGMAVSAANATIYKGLERAERDVPVRRVFHGGKQTVRFKTAEEIEADRGLRSRLGLAPEILATPEDIARFRSAGINPKRSAQVAVTDLRTDKVARNAAARVGTSGRTHVTQGGTSVGFARTVTRADRSNSWRESEEARLLEPTLQQHLADRGGERYLTSRGRYELRTGRATSSRVVAKVDLASGRIFFSQTDRPRLGGGLKSTLRVERASADQFPVISASLLAGDREHDYAKYQELGTRHNAAHPFLRPRLVEWKTELPAQLRRAFKGRSGR